MYRRLITAALLALVAATSASAYTTHKVKGKETTYGIANHYHISVETLLLFNPEAAHGLRKGMTLRIPDAAEIEAAKCDRPLTGEEAAREERAVDPATQVEESFRGAGAAIAPPTPPLTPVDDVADPAAASDQLQQLQSQGIASLPLPVFGVKPQNVMLAMPFMTEEDERSRQSLLSLDFYKGFLLSLEEKGGSHYPLRLITCDTNASEGMMEVRLKQATEEDVRLLIAPEGAEEFKMSLDYGRNNMVYVLNLFNVKDESYLTNRYSIQTNIPQHLMYSKAISYLLNEMADYTPVILAPHGARAEKEPFVAALKKAYAAKRRNVIDLPCGATLQSSDLSSLDPDGKYVFIPKSGSVNVFNKFAATLADYRMQRTDPTTVRLFGYPDWMAFKGDQLRALHSLQAVYYSRVFLDPESPRVQEVESAYDQWFEGRPLEGVPVQCFLGYDTAGLIHYLLNLGPLSAIRGMDRIEYRGLQSAFCLERQDDGGFVNTALYIVECLPGSVFSTTVK